jgi:superfamily II DNA or RNA helicase
VCQKPRIKCSICQHRKYIELDDAIIEAHLRGKIVVGIYPLTEDEKCYFLAFDFDEAEWEKDVAAVRAICHEHNIPIAVERSRSGNGAHLWIFFAEAISASLARKMGSALLTHAMSKRHEISFNSYDRLFPNQDTMPKGGFGNLIALPLQALPRKSHNTVFIDEQFLPYNDQWDFLRGIKKFSTDNVHALITRLGVDNDLGYLKVDTEENPKPWERRTSPTKLTHVDFPKQLQIVKADMLYVEKEGCSQRALNHIKRLAAFKNPEFYKAQAMRMPTYNKPRVISCSDESEKHLVLPRGCATDLFALFDNINVSHSFSDKTNAGRMVQVEFSGILREEQQEAVAELLRHQDGVLAATTAFGKTVVAAKLIAERKVNTLILVHRKQLLAQWIMRLSEFLMINETIVAVESAQKRGRKKKLNIIGSFCAGKNQLSSIIDVAVMQSLYCADDIREHVKNYGMIIVDECHHVPAFSFEQIIKQANAKYIYGLTATPARKDGHHPIIFMYCGPIRFRVDALKQAQQRPFAHFVIPRFTSFCMPDEDKEQGFSIQDVYASIVHDEIRNQLIVNDVLRCHEAGRHCLVLTERTEHVKMLAKMLSQNNPNVIALTGGMSAKETTALLGKIAATAQDEALTIVATGKLIGEGFDEPRLDTLFLAMPISWKGTLQQYAGRLHRIYEGKKEVQIYDYVDVRVRMLERMYSKRLRGYAAIGYQAKGPAERCGTVNNIYDKHSFFPIYRQDMEWAKKNILIVSPFVTQKRVIELLQILREALARKIKVTVVMRSAEDFTGKFRDSSAESIRTMLAAGIALQFKRKIHQKFAIIDQKIVWYGSINLLSFGYSEESVMRIVSASIAMELIASIGV